MPPYWENKALPTPTLTLCLFPSFLLKINAFPMRYDIWKGRKKVFGSNSGQSRQKAHIYTFLKCVDHPNHMLVGGVSVNSLCQQGRLFALSVNRHSVWIVCVCVWESECVYWHNLFCIHCNIAIFITWSTASLCCLILSSTKRLQLNMKICITAWSVYSVCFSSKAMLRGWFLQRARIWHQAVKPL